MATKRERLLIVDGYNVLRSGKRYQAITEPDYTDDAFNRARETLINDVVSFAGKESRAVIVFDGAKNQFSEGKTETIGGVHIMFSPTGQSADVVIEKLAREGRNSSLETLVVTSDATIQDTVFGGGVDRMSANDFCWEIEAIQEDSKAEVSTQAATKNTLADRLSPKTRARLEALRDKKAEK